MHSSVFRKLRRSLRIQEKTLDFNNRQTPLGFFSKLPLEIIHLVFNYLPVEDLGLLTLTSKPLRDLIEEFANSTKGLKWVAPKCVLKVKTSVDQVLNLRRQFKNLGIFMKRLTCLYPTKERLRKIDLYVSKLKCEENECQCLRKCASLTYYGKFIHTIIRGWDNSEYSRVFEAIEKKSKIMRYIERTLFSQLGSRKHLELIIRLFYRSVFLDECETAKQKSFWLSTILKSIQIAHQAKLFLILYAPIHNDEIQWTEMNEHVIANLDEAKYYFKDLALGVFMLHYLNKDWHDDDIISFLNEVFNTPNEWLPENIATLLYMCGKDITLLYTAEMVDKGNFDEVATLLTSLSLISIKCEGEHLFAMSVITSICDRITSKPDKLQFWSAIADAFRSAIVCSFDLAEIGDEDAEQTMMRILDSFTELFKHSLNYWNFDSEE